MGNEVNPKPIFVNGSLLSSERQPSYIFDGIYRCLNLEL